MLDYLRIRNLALIEDVELEFSAGLNALTGETGAGKSFILKALSFLTGDKLAADMVRPGEDKAQVEALFTLPDAEYAFRRELVAETGRSRLFVNDQISSQDTVRALRPSLLIHTSQHGQQRLLQPAYQARILDGFVANQALLRSKDQLLAQLKDLIGQRTALLDRSRELREKRELYEFQLLEIAKVDPQPEEELALEARKLELRAGAQAQEAVGEIVSLLRAQENGLYEGLARLSHDLELVAGLVPECATDRELVEEFRLQLQEMEGRLRRQRFLTDGKAELESIEARLWKLAQLKRKLNRSLSALVELRREAEENISFLDSCGLDLKRLEKEQRALAGELAACLLQVNQARRAAAKTLSDALEDELRGLGFSEHARVICDFSPHPLLPEHPELPGLVEDRVRFLWLPNPGQAPQPLDKIASGGELSRFLLALVSIEAKAEQPTLIFDEVDAGVGGVTLNRVGERLKSLAEGQQVILITHWPQLASLAQRHFLVKKDIKDGQTYTRCARLQTNELFDELARMAGGGEQGQVMATQLLTK